MTCSLWQKPKFLITALKSLKTPLTLEQGGTGAVTSADARHSLDLASATTTSIQTSSEDTDNGKVGAFGMGSNALPLTQDFTNRKFTGFYRTPVKAGSLSVGGTNYLCQSWHWDASNKVVTGFRLSAGLRYFAGGFISGDW